MTSSLEFCAADSWTADSSAADSCSADSMEALGGGGCGMRGFAVSRAASAVGSEAEGAVHSGDRMRTIADTTTTASRSHSSGGIVPK